MKSANIIRMTGATKENGKSNWLIKSGGRILGPFSKSEIANLLKTREVVVLDEVCSPLRRWQFLRDHPVFSEVIEELRSAIQEKTQTNWTPSSTDNLTASVTAPVDSDLTEQITEDLSEYMDSTREIVIESVPEQTRRLSSVTSARYQAVGAIGEQAVKVQAKKTAGWLWIFTCLVLGGLGVFVYMKRLDLLKQQHTVSGGDPRVAALAAIEIGDFPSAYKHLKQYVASNPNKNDMGIWYAPMAIQIDGQTVVGRRILNEFLKSGDAVRKLAFAGIGLADMIDGQLVAAAESFSSALAIEPNWVPAQINMAAIAIQKGELRQAKFALLKIIDGGAHFAEAYLLLGMLAPKLAKENDDPREILEAQAYLESYVQQHQDYLSEITVLLSQLYWLSENKKRSGEVLAKLLEIDPQLTIDHSHSVFIYSGLIDWKVLGPICQLLNEHFTANAEVTAQMGLCELYQGRLLDAKRSLENAVAQEPHNGLLQAWYAYVLQRSQLQDQASIALGRAVELNRKSTTVIPNLFQARFCEEKANWECAMNHWKSVLQREPENLAALSGLAHAFHERKSFEDKQELLQKGLAVSEDYIPLRRLKAASEPGGA